jgi:hypothetical protein
MLNEINFHIGKNIGELTYHIWQRFDFFQLKYHKFFNVLDNKINHPTDSKMQKNQGLIDECSHFQKLYFSNSNISNFVEIMILSEYHNGIEVKYYRKLC